MHQPHAVDQNTPAMQRSHARALRVVCCPTSSSGRVALRPSVAVNFLSHRCVSRSFSQKRWPGSVMTQSLVRLVAGTPSSVAIEMPNSPSTADDHQFLHDFVKLPRSRQEFAFDILRYHLPLYNRLLCFINRFELMLVLGHFQ